MSKYDKPTSPERREAEKSNRRRLQELAVSEIVPIEKGKDPVELARELMNSDDYYYLNKAFESKYKDFYDRIENSDSYESEFSILS